MTTASARVATARRADSRIAAIVDCILPTRLLAMDGIRMGACGISAVETTEQDEGLLTMESLHVKAGCMPALGHALNSGTCASRLFFWRRKSQTISESG
jgi:hypothetical protein